MTNSHLKPLVSNDILWRRDGEENELVILASCNGGSIRFLNPVAGLILELSNGKNTVDDIVDHIMKNYDCADKANVEKDVNMFLKILVENGVVFH